MSDEKKVRYASIVLFILILTTIAGIFIYTHFGGSRNRPRATRLRSRIIMILAVRPSL